MVNFNFHLFLNPLAENKKLVASLVFIYYMIFHCLFIKGERLVHY